MIISRTTDIAFITQCVLHSWDMSSDDWCKDKSSYFPPMGTGFIWVRAGDYGVYLLEKKNHIMYEVHTCLLPIARGSAVEITKEALQWGWDNLSALRIITTVPEFNPLALRLAKKVGMIEYGRNTKSFMKNGQLFDQILLGINKC